MKQFDLQEYLKNPEQKVVTRDGRNVRVICTDRKGLGVDRPYPIVALIECHDEICKTEAAVVLNPEGRLHSKIDNGADLFFAPKEGWINIYKITSEDPGVSKIYNSKEEAEAMAKSYDDYVDTIKIEWEE